MPDKFCSLAEILLNCVPRVVIAIASRKDNDTEVHRFGFGETISFYQNEGVRVSQSQ